MWVEVDELAENAKMSSRKLRPKSKNSASTVFLRWASDGKLGGPTLTRSLTCQYNYGFVEYGILVLLQCLSPCR